MAGRYVNAIPTRFLAPIDCLKIPVLPSSVYTLYKWELKNLHDMSSLYFIFFEKWLVYVLYVNSQLTVQ
jgi:hypothetical protein